MPATPCTSGGAVPAPEAASKRRTTPSLPPNTRTTRPPATQDVTAPTRTRTGTPADDDQHTLRRAPMTVPDDERPTWRIAHRCTSEAGRLLGVEVIGASGLLRPTAIAAADRISG
jgi:hypothetical protein